MQLSHVELAPATCLFCKRTPEPGELFVNTLTKIVRGPVRDHAYLCPECGGKIAAALGWVDPKAHAALAVALDEAENERTALENELAAAREDALAFIERVVAESKPKRAPRAKPADEPVSAE